MSGIAVGMFARFFACVQGATQMAARSRFFCAAGRQERLAGPKATSAILARLPRGAPYKETPTTDLGAPAPKSFLSAAWPLFWPVLCKSGGFPARTIDRYA
jgi:hypothetical protein